MRDGLAIRRMLGYIPQPISIDGALTARENLEFWERLEELREEAGTTLLVTTHQMEEAERQCDRIAIMDLGTLAAQGTPAQLCAEFGVQTLDDVFTACSPRQPAARSRKEGASVTLDASRSSSASRHLWERDVGQLQRLLATPLPRLAIVLGKAAGAGIRALAQATVLLVVIAVTGISIRWSVGGALVLLGVEAAGVGFEPTGA